MNLQAIILAAGKGTRLQPLTLARSKAMMPVAGEPMLARVLEILAVTTLTEIIIVAHPEDSELHEQFGSLPGVRIVHQAERKGAAHALACAAPFIHGDFILSACDNLVDPLEAERFVNNFQRHSQGQPCGRLALVHMPAEKMTSMGMVVWDGETINSIVEKPSAERVVSNLASIPLYCFSRHFLDYLPHIQPSRRGEYELQDGMQMFINQAGELRGELFSGRETVTDARDLLELNLRYLAREAKSPAQNLYPGVHFNAPCLVETGAQIERGARLGPGVLVERGSTIGADAHIRRALVLRGANIAPGEMIDDQVCA